MSKRDPYFDNLKFILITLVVVGHFISAYLRFADSGMLDTLKTTLWVFHMPAFIFVSGLFAKRLCTREKGLDVNTVTYYLVLYVLFYCLLYVERSLYGHPVFNPFNVSEAPWYLLAMAILGSSTALVSRVKLGWKLVIPASLIMSFVSGFFPGFGSFLSLGRIVNFAPFYFAGYYLNANWVSAQVSTLRSKRWPLVIAATVLCVVAVTLAFAPEKYFTALNRLSIAHYSFANCESVSVAVAACMRVGWFALATVMTACLCILIPIGKTFYSKAGSKTLQVYILHAFIYYPLGGAGLMRAYIGLSLPASGLWVIVAALLITWVLALPDAPTKLFRFVRCHTKVACE